MTNIPSDPITSLAHMLWLAAQTPNFIKLPLDKLAGGFQDAIDKGEFRIYRSADGVPLGCVTWVWLHEQYEETAIAAMLDGPFGTSLQKEWIGGDQLWFFSFIAPFGHGRVIADDLRHRVFPGVNARALRMDKHGNFKKAATFHNKRRS